jgi:AbrB family looped-hinge helix DNA binding protein
MYYNWIKYYDLRTSYLFQYREYGEEMKAKTSTVTQKGQIVIPSKLRRKLGIRQGTQIAFIEEGERLVLQPLTAEYVKNLRGVLKGGHSPLKILFEERKRDRKL